MRAELTRERVDAWCERGILALVLAVVVFGPLALGAVRPADFLGIQFLTVAVLLLWLVRVWLGKPPRLLWTPLCWMVAAFVAYAIFRYATADVEYVARQELLRVLVYAALFFAILNNLHRQQTTRVVVFTLLGLGTLLAFYALYQWLTESEDVWHYLKPRCYFKRASGSYICPDHFAVLLGLLLPLALSYTLTGRLKPVPRVLLGYAAFMMLAGLAVTLSRWTWLASAIALAVFFGILLRHRTYRMTSLIGVGLILAGALVFKLTSVKTHDRLLQSSGERYERTPWVEIWPAAWRMWQDHFWVGVGPGLFDQRYREYRAPTEGAQSRPGRAHNDYLNTLADWGLAGTLLVLGAWAALFWGVCRGWRFIRRSTADLNQKKSNKSAFVLGACIGFATLLVASWFDFNLHIPANAILTVTLMALVTSHLRFASDRYWVSQRVAGRALISLVLGAGVFCLAGQGWGLAREQWWLARSNNPALEPEARIEMCQKAFAAEPKNAETAYAIGELIRTFHWGDEGATLNHATNALGWFRRSAALNHYDPSPVLRIGMCQHWARNPEAATEWFDKALKLDPNSYYVYALVGWHYFQLEDYQKARDWFLKSLRLKPTDNKPAEIYLRRIENKLKEQKTQPR